MSRSFAIALLAPALAFARGDDSGYGRENAIETVLLERTKETLTLFTYNAWNGDVPEIHGDLELTLAPKPEGQADPMAHLPERAFGFCFEMTESTMDCMHVEVDLLDDPALIAWTFKDLNATVDGEDVVDKADVDATAEDAAISWVNIPAKSEVTGCTEAKFGTVPVAADC